MSAVLVERGEQARHGTFCRGRHARRDGVQLHRGGRILDALHAAGAERLARKTLIDVANPLDFSHGTPPTLSPVGSDSPGEQIQREFPDARVVKALNTVNYSVMVDPARVPGEHDIFICGDDDSAKTQVREGLQSFG